MALSTRTRACTRAQIMVRAELSSGKTRVITGSTSNVSLKGVYFLPDKWVPVGTECQVTIRFAGPTSSLKIEGSGRIVRSDESGLGIEFLDMTVDSLEHLRNLVRYNATDIAQVEREFADHVGIKHKKS
ncbi:MAG: PilZ domain-containing protein [Vicinamibacterales bacterium]